MTRPSNSDGQDSANWWNEKGKDELEQLEFLQKEMMRAMKKPMMGPEDEEEDMGPPDLPEDDEDMGPPDIPEDDEMALEPTPREMDMQDRMNGRRERAMRRPRMRNRAKRMMQSGAPRGSMSKSLQAEMELKRAFSPEKRRELAKEGMALPDGSFPIVTVGDLENAIMAFGRAKNKGAAKRHIMKRARALKRTDMIPGNWGKKDASKGTRTKGGMYGMPMEMPKKKKKLRYGEKEADMAEMEDDELTSPMSREELMDRVFKKKKKKPMNQEAEVNEEDMTEDGEEPTEA